MEDEGRIMATIWKIFFFLIAIWAIFMIAMLIFHLATKKYVDRYTLTLYFGRKGCGKSCTMQKEIIKHHKRGWNIYADIGSTYIPYVNQINGKYFYKYEYPPDSVIFLDESVIKFNNRNWKSFEEEAQNWFVEQRKHKCKVIMFANTFGVDSKIRDLNDELVLCRKFFRILMIGRRWYKIPIIISAEQSNREAVECDDYKKIPWIFGGIKITFLPKYVRKFNTNAMLSKNKQKNDATASPIAPASDAVGTHTEKKEEEAASKELSNKGSIEK